jgi:hypothetical protein
MFLYVICPLFVREKVGHTGSKGQRPPVFFAREPPQNLPAERKRYRGKAWELYCTFIYRSDYRGS